MTLVALVKYQPLLAPISVGTVFACAVATWGSVAAAPVVDQPRVVPPPADRGLEAEGAAGQHVSAAARHQHDVVHLAARCRASSPAPAQ